MDLVIEKLETFGLDNFIDVYRFYLCRRTVSQNQIAAFLQFDADHIANIAHPADNFSQCEKLYELIQRTSTVRNFLEALNETGNEHIIKFIKETDFSALGQLPSTSTNPNSNRRRGLWFNIPELIKSFCGREPFLSQLHAKLKPRDDAETEVTVLSQVKIVSGLGGIGKTQTARKYILKYSDFYNNFIWVDAESENSMRTSFLKLAAELQIPVQNPQGRDREMQEIVKETYNKICKGGKSNLIVFDNVEDYLSCRQFFPFGLHPDLTKPVILATSRNQEWISSIGEIEFITLDVLAYDESLEFILKQLDIQDSPEFREESKEFIELIGGLPLALQQAVAYVKHQKRVNELVGRSYKMKEYVKKFKSSSEKLQNIPHAPDSSTTVFGTWNLTLEKIKEDPKGEMAIEIIQVMSFLYADKIPVEFLLQLLPLPQKRGNWLQNLFGQRQDNSNDQPIDLGEGLKLLEKFSMIKITGDFVSIHRQVQSVIIHDLKSSRKLVKVLDHTIYKCTVILKNMQSTEPEPTPNTHTDIFLNLHQLVSNHIDCIPVELSLYPNVVDFMLEFGLVLGKASGETEVLELNQQVDRERRSWNEVKRDVFGSVFFLTVAQSILSDNVSKWNTDESSAGLPLKITRLFDIIGFVYVNHKIQRILAGQEQLGVRFKETLEQLEESLPQVILQHGPKHPLTFQTQLSIASLQRKISHVSKFLIFFKGGVMKVFRLSCMCKVVIGILGL